MMLSQWSILSSPVLLMYVCSAYCAKNEILIVRICYSILKFVSSHEGTCSLQYIHWKTNCLDSLNAMGKSQSILLHTLRQRMAEKLAYFNDIFTRINKLSKSLQGRFTTAIDCVDKIWAFIMKLELFCSTLLNPLSNSWRRGRYRS